MSPYVFTDIIPWKSSDMVEIYLEDSDDFLKIRETLSRIGVSSKKEHNVLYQSCHILHKQGRYYIVHFKELFLLDGKPSTFTYEDSLRRNAITTLLSDWGLLRIADILQVHEVSNLAHIKVIPHSKKSEWDLRCKYDIGTFKK
jgi:hypothetical protein